MRAHTHACARAPLHSFISPGEESLQQQALHATQQKLLMLQAANTELQAAKAQAEAEAQMLRRQLSRCVVRPGGVWWW